MEVTLLKSDIAEAFNEPNDQIRLGKFWTIARLYDDIVPILKIVLVHDIQKLTIAKCDIIRHDDEKFLIKDSTGNQSLFARNELQMIVDLWDKSQQL